MGYSNVQLETSTGSGRGERGEPGLPGIGFNLTDDGNSDLDSRRLTDVADPVDDQDAATKKYVDDENARQDIAINSKAEGDRVLLLDGSKSMTGNLQMGSKRITNLADPSENTDAVHKKYLNGGTMKGGFIMSGNRIYSLPLPTGSQQPATKEYTEKYCLRKTGNETTDYNAGSKKIVNLSPPTDDNDAANKKICP